MFPNLNLSLLLALSTSLTTLISANPIPDVEPQTARLFIGWKGLQQGSTIDKKNPIRGGGQLGHVFYVADDTDLARFFSGTHVCEITVDAKIWSLNRKHWLSHVEAHSGSDAVDLLYPGSVIFAAHDAPPQGDPSPWQMGIRLNEFKTLAVDGTCYPKEDNRVRAGQKMSYEDLSQHWGITGNPERLMSDDLDVEDVDEEVGGELEVPWSVLFRQYLSGVLW